METQDMQDKQEKQETQAKSTKERLDELRGLHNNGYVTESEFKAARVNILKDNGFDVSTRQQQPAYRPSYREREREEEETQQGGGCGCFLMTIMLIFLILGACFIAAPHWPNNLGGSAVRSAREWFTGQVVMVINHFRGQPAPVPVAPPVTVPDPHNEERQEETPAPVFPPALPYNAYNNNVPEAEQPDSIELAEELVEELTETPLPEVDPVEQIEIGQTETALPVETTVSPVTPPQLPTVPTGTGLPPLDESLMLALPGIEPDPSEPAATRIRGHVISANVRIRSAPGTTTDNVIGWARQGERFTVLEEGTDNLGARWLYVVYDTGNRRGWTSASLVRLEN